MGVLAGERMTVNVKLDVGRWDGPTVVVVRDGEVAMVMERSRWLKWDLVGGTDCFAVMVST